MRHYFGHIALVVALVAMILTPALGAAASPSVTPGHVWAWGENYAGQLGTGTTTWTNVPVEVPALSNVVGLAGAASQSYALTSTGAVWSWGSNGSGQLGTGVVGGTSTVPVKVMASAGVRFANVATIKAGHVHALALKTDGTVWAWGSNEYGQLGDGTIGGTQAYPVQVVASWGGRTVQEISAGGEYNLALMTDGTLWSWGWNNNGQLGIGSTGGSKAKPVQVLASLGHPLTGVVDASAGRSHAIAVMSDTTVQAWGWNFYGSLGDGKSGLHTNRNLPVHVIDQKGHPLTGIATVTGGATHTLALTPGGTVWSWGWNLCGQLGYGSVSTPQVVPYASPVPNLPVIVALGASGDHSMAVTASGIALAWGEGSGGEMGNGTNVQKNFTPLPVSNLTSVGVVAGGFYHDLAIAP